ncbi:MAG TPA: DUF6328 family protein [Burkholderiales bacterium]|jgi:hypothetical protein|nr:DUF6328 family protein [Burkholderiales bacterium]
MKPAIEFEPLKDQARNMLDEARMVLPGVQALLGFQLIAVFNQRFESLDFELQVIHLTALLLVTLSVVLVMAPAAYHRIVERDRISDYFVRLASLLIAGAMIPLAAGISLDIYVIARMVLASAALSAVVAGATILLFCSLWFAFPLLRRARQG